MIGCKDMNVGEVYQYGKKTRTITNIVNWDIYYKDNNGNIHKCDYYKFKRWIKTGKNKIIF